VVHSSRQSPGELYNIGFKISESIFFPFTFREKAGNMTKTYGTKPQATIFYRTVHLEQASLHLFLSVSTAIISEFKKTTGAMAGGRR